MSDRDKTPIVLPSNRSFGTLFVVVFALVGGWSLWRGGSTYPWWFGASIVTLLFTLLAPSLLTPLNRAWMKFGELLARIVNPIVLGILFYLIITPFGVVKRMTGWDPMRRRLDRDAGTYWIDRRPPGPNPDSLPNQY